MRGGALGAEEGQCGGGQRVCRPQPEQPGLAGERAEMSFIVGYSNVYKTFVNNKLPASDM